MKKMLTTTLAIVLPLAPTFADDWFTPEMQQLFNESSRARTAAEEAGARAEIAKINDTATLEKIAKDDIDPFMPRFAREKLNEMKKSGVIINEIEQPIHEAPPQAQSEKTSSQKIFFGIVVVALLAVFGGVTVWKKAR
jgi:hypothetical protein